MTTKSPLQDFLFNAVEAQETHNTTFTVNHMCILRELYVAHLYFQDGRFDTNVVPLKHIEEKYRVPKYIASRNAKMLSTEGIKDKTIKGVTGTKGLREGKGFLTIVPLSEKNTIEGAAFDSRNKGMKLTKKGERVCEILFQSIKRQV